MNENKYYPITKMRHRFLNALRKLHMHFKDLRNFNAIDILFPHTWLLNPYASDRKYKWKCRKNTELSGKNSEKNGKICKRLA